MAPSLPRKSHAELLCFSPAYAWAPLTFCGMQSPRRPRTSRRLTLASLEGNGSSCYMDISSASKAPKPRPTEGFSFVLVFDRGMLVLFTE